MGKHPFFLTPKDEQKTEPSKTLREISFLPYVLPTRHRASAPAVRPVCTCPITDDKGLATACLLHSPPAITRKRTGKKLEKSFLWLQNPEFFLCSEKYLYIYHDRYLCFTHLYFVGVTQGLASQANY